MMRFGQTHLKALLAVTALTLGAATLALLRPDPTSAAATVSDDGKAESAALARTLGAEPRLSAATTLRVASGPDGLAVHGSAASLYEEEIVSTLAHQAATPARVELALPTPPPSDAELRASVDEALHSSGAERVAVWVDRGHVRLHAERGACDMGAAMDAVKKIPGVLVVDGGPRPPAATVATTARRSVRHEAAAPTATAEPARTSYFNPAGEPVTVALPPAAEPPPAPLKPAPRAEPAPVPVAPGFLAYLRQTLWPLVLAGLGFGLFFGLVYAWWSASEERDAVRAAIHAGPVDSFLKGLSTVRMDVLKLEQEDAGRARRELAARERALVTLERQASTKQGLVAESDLELGRVRQQLGARETELGRLEAELAKLDAAVAEHDKKIQDLELGLAEKERAAREVEVAILGREPALTTAAVEVERLRAELAALRLRLEGLGDQERELRGAALTRSGQAAELGTLFKEREAAIKDLRAKLAELRAKLDASRRDLDGGRKRLEEARDKRDQAAAESAALLGRIESQESDIVTLLAQQAERERRLAAARERAGALTKDIDASRSEATTLKRRIESLDQRLVKVAEEQKEKLAAVEAQVRTRKPEVKEMAKAAEKARASRDKSAAALAAARTARSERERDKVRLDQELRDASEALARAKREEDETRARLGAVEAVLAGLEAEVKDARTFAAKAQEQATAAAAALATDSTAHDELVARAATLGEHIAARAAERDAANARLQAVQSQQAQAREALDALKAEIKTAAAEHKRAETESEHIANGLSQGRSTLATSRKALAKLVSSIEATEASRAKLEAQGARIESEIAELERELAARAAELGAAESSFQTTRGEVKTTTTSYERASQGFDELEARLKTLRAELKTAESESTSWSRRVTTERKLHDDLARKLADLLGRMDAAKQEMA